MFVFENSIASSEEYDFAVEISKFIHRSHEIYTYGRDENIFEKLCEVDYAIASRYHANIIWQKIGVPVIPIPYAPKVYSLYLSSGIKLNPIDSMDFSTEYQRLPSFENFKISNPYTNIKVYFRYLKSSPTSFLNVSVLLCHPLSVFTIAYDNIFPSQCKGWF